MVQSTETDSGETEFLAHVERTFGAYPTLTQNPHSQGISARVQRLYHAGGGSSLADGHECRRDCCFGCRAGG